MKTPYEEAIAKMDDGFKYLDKRNREAAGMISLLTPEEAGALKGSIAFALAHRLIAMFLTAHPTVVERTSMRMIEMLQRLDKSMDHLAEELGKEAERHEQ